MHGKKSNVLFRKRFVYDKSIRESKRELKRGSIILRGSIIKQWAFLAFKPHSRYTSICSSLLFETHLCHIFCMYEIS